VRPNRTETRTSASVGGAPRSGPLLFRVLRCDRVRGEAARYDLGDATRVDIGRGDAEAATLSDRRLEIHVDDRWMSTRHVRLERSLAAWLLHDDGAKNAVLLRGAPTRRAMLSDGEVFEAGGTFFLYRASMPTGEAGTRVVAPTGDDPFATLVPALESELSRLAVIARSALPVILRGESGVGKAHLARALHARSERRGPFVTAHADLDARRLREAHGGTLYLDELADLSPDAQSLLLAAMRAREADAPDAPDLRFVSASHADLDALVAAGGLRADLHARLSAYAFTLPPLRERREDLGLLVGAMLGRAAPERVDALRFDPAAARALLASPWPGNLRALDGALRAAATLADDGLIRLDHVPESLRMPKGPSSVAPAPVAAGSPAAATTLTLALEGEYWTVRWGSVVLRQKDSVGIRYLAHLVERPGVEVHVSDLSNLARRARADAASEAPEALEVGGDDAGPMLDAEAKGAYMRRLDDLRETVDEATSWGDRERAERAQAEIDAIARELARAVGLGGRDRKASATAERMRVSVTLRIRDAMKRIHEGSDALGRHLAAGVRTGVFCAYTPP